MSGVYGFRGKANGRFVVFSRNNSGHVGRMRVTRGVERRSCGGCDAFHEVVQASAGERHAPKSCFRPCKRNNRIYVSVSGRNRVSFKVYQCVSSRAVRGNPRSDQPGVKLLHTHP